MKLPVRRSSKTNSGFVLASASILLVIAQAGGALVGLLNGR